MDINDKKNQLKKEEKALNIPFINLCKEESNDSILNHTIIIDEECNDNDAILLEPMTEIISNDSRGLFTIHETQNNHNHLVCFVLFYD